ncbi:hypothetical protein [Mesorhizobium sp. M2A.F.Ca.ET.043.02.1.1]|uniref:hypothetical protein n=1 Tax=Mesorhizobium sp. M2A.F.Ca.ET.043.02.1.1 TaxID=2493670 RepID=UPI001AECCC69|nr:hypothetical protein [Mesorhizobium sp. M2A.F.Ca.ET.043.02.1.1]
MTSLILENGKTPEEWVKIFKAERGVHLSARTIRENARRLGACRMLGKVMMLLPEHIDRLFQEPQTCPSNSTNATDGGGSKAESTAYRAANTTDKALAYLSQRQKGTPKRQSRPSNSRRSNVISLETKGR